MNTMLTVKVNNLNRKLASGFLLDKANIMTDIKKTKKVCMVV